MREKAIVSCAKDWARKNENKTDVTVLVYSMHSPFMKAAKAVKKIIPTAKIVVTVADLPLYMDMKGGLRKVLKQVDWHRIKRLMKSVDKYLLYTKYMADYLQLPNEKWMVFEGLFDAERAVDDLQEKEDGKICIYAGNLDARYGIKMLVDAFDKIKSDAVLHIYGAGFDKEYIEHLTQNAKNVQYKGVVTSDEMFRIMKGATLLINPRPSTIGLAKYSCPSKTFEYMASGTPLLTTRLEGIPSEYFDHSFSIEDNAVCQIKDALVSILNLSDEELKQKGKIAQQFVRENKNAKTQSERIVTFLLKLVGEKNENNCKG
jgi:glycosyltransferase involved in cell wall biosynthesis